MDLRNAAGLRSDNTQKHRCQQDLKLPSIKSDALEYVLVISLFNNIPIFEDSSIIETLCPADTMDEAKLYPSVLNP